MARKPAPPGERREPMLIRIRPELRGHLDLALFSPVEGRVPHGALSDFLNQLLTRYFLGTEPITPHYHARTNQDPK